MKPVITMVLPFVTAHAFCASRDGPRNTVSLSLFYAPFITSRVKQILARATEMQKENWR